MTLIARLRRVCFPLFLLTSLIASSSQAVQMEVSPGYGGIVKNSIWNPIAVHLKNDSSDAVNGVLEVTNGRGISISLCTTAVNLPGNSEKLYHIYFRSGDCGRQILVSLNARGGASEAVKLDSADLDDRLVVAVGQRSSRLAFLQGETMQVAPSRGNRYGQSSMVDAKIIAGSMLPYVLPDRPAGYEGINFLIISDMDASAVSPAALKAVASWVASGGLLVISTGPDCKRFSNPFYDDLLPVKITGAGNLSGAASLSAFGKSPFSAGQIAVASSVVKRGIGRVLAAEGGTPLLAVRDYGAGKVVFLALDYKASPFRDWSGQTEFWKYILATPVSKPMAQTITSTAEDFGGYRYGIDTADLGMLGVVAQQPSIKMPSYTTIWAFLVSYILLLVPVNFFVLRKMRRLELAWVTTPIIVLAFTFGAYAIGYTMKGGSLKVREATLIEGSSGARFARMVSCASVFSPARRSYDITVNDPAALAQVIATEESSVQAPVMLGGDKSVMPDVPIAMWSSLPFEAVSGVDLGGTLDSGLVLNGSTIDGKITNNTRFTLSNCCVGFGGSRQFIKDLKPGESAELHFKAVGSLHNLRNPYNMNQSGSTIAEYVDNHTKGDIVLTATTAQPDRRVFNIDKEKCEAQCESRCVFHLGYSLGSSFNIPSDDIRGRIVAVDGNDIQQINDSPSGGGVSVWGYNCKETRAIFELPVPPDSSISSLCANIDTQGSSAPFVVTALNQKTQKYDLLTCKPVGGSLTRATISDPERYLGQGNRITLKVFNAERMSLWLNATGNKK